MTLAPLATYDDIALHVEAFIPDGRLDRAKRLLVEASAQVRGYTGQEFTVGTSTAQILRPKNGVVRLPQRPVTAVTAVTDLNGNAVTYEWDGLDRLSVAGQVPDLWSFEAWRNGIATVKVTYTHGYTAVPDDIIGIVCQIAARALGTPPEESGRQQESIAGYSYSVGSAAAAGPFGMLSDERRTLDRYSHPQIGSIAIGFR